MQHDPALLAGALWTAESALNKALALAPYAAQEFAQLGGTVIAITLTQPELTVFAEVTEDGSISLKSVFEGAPTTRVQGSLDAFIALMTSEDPAATLINSELEIRGNSAPLIALQQIVKTLEIDWEAPLVERLGDVAGHQLAQLLRRGAAWGKQSAESLRRQVAEYITEEGRLAPGALELEAFYQDIEQLQQRTERLQSRLSRLAGKIAAQTERQRHD
jgi:ubiquinone biosynthesis protein UbiJ